MQKEIEDEIIIIINNMTLYPDPEFVESCLRTIDNLLHKFLVLRQKTNHGLLLSQNLEKKLIPFIPFLKNYSKLQNKPKFEIYKKSDGTSIQIDPRFFKYYQEK